MKTLTSHDPVLCEDGSALVVQQLQLITGKLCVVTVASNSPPMVGQESCETLLSSCRSGSVLTEGGNSWWGGIKTERFKDSRILY